MKYTKQIICLTLAAAFMFLASCNTGKPVDNTSDRTGRYVETDVTPPVDGRFMCFTANDGTLVCYDTGLHTRYVSADDGATWSESPGPGSATDDFANVSSGTLLPDGRLLAYVQDKGLTLISPDGGEEHYAISDIDAAVANGDGVSVTLLQSLGNDRLLLSYSVGGMNVIGNRPLGQPDQGGGRQNDATAPIGTQDTVASDGAGTATLSGPDAQGSAPDVQGSGPDAQGSAPDAQGSGPQRPGAQGNYSSMAINPSSRTCSLYELSSGDVIAELQADNATAAAADDETLYLMDFQGNINQYDLKDGAPLKGAAVNLGGGGTADARGRNNMMAMPGMTSGTLTVNSDGGIYALYDGNLLRCEAGGDVSTTLEGTAYSIGAPNSTAVSVYALGDGAIIVSMLDNMQSNSLYRYVWDDNAEINPDKTLSVWSLEDNAFVRAAISELRKKNPDSYITYEVAVGGDNAISDADAIKTLNARILNGSGPDVLILDGCPVASYADRGILMDLSALVDVGDVYQNLLSSYITDGKMYCLPTQLYMPALMGSQEALAKAQTLDDLVNLVVNGNDTPAGRSGPGGGGGGGFFTGIPEDERAELYFENLSELCNIMWMSGAPAIIKDNSLDTDALRQYLTAIKAISDKYDLTSADAGGAFGIGVAFASGGRATALSGSLVRYTSQMTNYGAFSAGNLMLLQLTMDRGGSEMAPFPGLVPGAWQPSTVAGISADTKVADFAVEFLRTMLSVDVQQINYGEGLPVTRAGIAAQIQAMNDLLAQNDRDPFVLDMDAVIETLTAPSVNDSTLTGMMWTSVEKLCKGETDVEGAVKEIEQNVKNYLAERA